jgi:hypothetical protein
LLFYLSEPCLCQSETIDAIGAFFNEPVQETIESLKTSLQSHTANFNQVYRQYINCYSLYNEGLKRTDIDFDIMNGLDNAMSRALKYAIEDLTEIRAIEEKIKVMDITFKSSTPKK